MIQQILITIFIAIITLIIGFIIGKFITKKTWEEKVPNIKQDAIKRSRASLAGNFSEQLAPYLPDFPFKPTEAKFLGKPIDLIVFQGSDEKNIEKVIFVEIKSGKSTLNQQEKNLKKTIQEKKVEWHEYRVPENLTKKKE